MNKTPNITIISGIVICILLIISCDAIIEEGITTQLRQQAIIDSMVLERMLNVEDSLQTICDNSMEDAIDDLVYQALGKNISTVTASNARRAHNREVRQKASVVKRKKAKARAKRQQTIREQTELAKTQTPKPNPPSPQPIKIQKEQLPPPVVSSPNQTPIFAPPPIPPQKTTVIRSQPKKTTDTPESVEAIANTATAIKRNDTATSTNNQPRIFKAKKSRGNAPPPDMALPPPLSKPTSVPRTELKQSTPPIVQPKNEDKKQDVQEKPNNQRFIKKFTPKPRKESE